MSPESARRLRNGLNALAVTTVAAALVAVAFLLRPMPAWTPPKVDLGSPAASDTVEPASLSLDDLAVIWRRDLRQPLFDQVVEPSTPEPPRLAVELVGTAIESAARYAVFRLPDQRVVVKPIGGLVEGFEVVSVERGKARLRNGAQEFDLTVSWYERIAARGSD